jgi:hypothetical protein
MTVYAAMEILPFPSIAYLKYLLHAVVGSACTAYWLWDYSGKLGSNTGYNYIEQKGCQEVPRPAMTGEFAEYVGRHSEYLTRRKSRHALLAS